MEKLSQALKTLIDTPDPPAQVSIHILLDGEMSAQDTETVITAIKAHLADEESFELLRRMKIVLCSTSVDGARKISELPGVLSVDLDSSAPLEELMDR